MVSEESVNVSKLLSVLQDNGIDTSKFSAEQQQDIHFLLSYVVDEWSDIADDIFEEVLGTALDNHQISQEMYDELLGGEELQLVSLYPAMDEVMPDDGSDLSNDEVVQLVYAFHEDSKSQFAGRVVLAIGMPLLNGEMEENVVPMVWFPSEPVLLQDL